MGMRPTSCAAPWRIAPAWFVLALLLAGPLTGCRDDGPADPATMSRARFIEAMVALREVALATSDTAEYEIRRDSVLAELGVTPDMLFHFVQNHGHDVRRMTEIWDTIAARLEPAAVDESVQ